MGMSAILKNPRMTLVALVIFGLPLLTGCQTTQGEQTNLVPKGFQTMIVPLVLGSGNPFVGGVLHGYGDDSITFTARNKRQSVRQK